MRRFAHEVMLVDPLLCYFSYLSSLPTPTRQLAQKTWRLLCTARGKAMKLLDSPRFPRLSTPTRRYVHSQPGKCFPYLITTLILYRTHFAWPSCAGFTVCSSWCRCRHGHFGDPLCESSRCITCMCKNAVTLVRYL